MTPNRFLGIFDDNLDFRMYYAQIKLWNSNGKPHVHDYYCYGVTGIFGCRKAMN